MPQFRIRRNLGLLLAALLTVLSVIVASSAKAQGNAPESSSGAFNADNARVGDIVSRGVRRADGTCEFQPFTVSLTRAPGEQRQWVGIELDSTNCHAVVSARWAGGRDVGPSDIVGPLRRLLATQTDELSESSSSTSLSDIDYPLLSPAAVDTCRTSEQLVYSYGYGGDWDRLTTKRGVLTFCYNGSTAWITYQKGYCAGSDPFGDWWWNMDGCWETSINNGPASSVWREGRGNYHCAPTNIFPCNGSDPDGFYHSLFDREAGYASGTTSCTFGWTGTPVGSEIYSGGGRVRNQFLQGCN